MARPIFFGETRTIGGLHLRFPGHAQKERFDRLVLIEMRYHAGSRMTPPTTSNGPRRNLLGGRRDREAWGSVMTETMVRSPRNRPSRQGDPAA
jgi:hypothetical protein